jgi:hypothetical protein
MSDIQRWSFPSGAGDFVRYADHVEALRQARADEREKCQEKVWNFDRGYEQGHRDALAGAVQRVEAISADDLDKVNPLRERILLPTFLITQRAVIAAIKGDSDG